MLIFFFNILLQINLMLTQSFAYFSKFYYLSDHLKNRSSQEFQIKFDFINGNQIEKRLHSHFDGFSCIFLGRKSAQTDDIRSFPLSKFFLVNLFYSFGLINYDVKEPVCN